MIKNKLDISILNFRSAENNLFSLLKKCEFDNPGTNQTDNIIKGGIKHCKEKYSHTFDYRCQYDKKLEHRTSGEVL